MRMWRKIISLALLLSLLPVAGPPALATSSTAVSQIAPPDDEIVLLTSAGQITVVDPNVPPEFEPVTFTSPTTGWIQVATGDFNGDGDDEIVATKPTLMQVFDPVVPPGGTPAGWTSPPPEGNWRLVATGDVDNDGRDEIIATHTTPRTNVAERLIVLDPNATGTGFTQIKGWDFGATMREIATGDVNGDGRDDIAFIRDVDKLVYIVAGGSWTLLHNQRYDFLWTGIDIGQTHLNTAKEEIMFIRTEVEFYLYSYLLRHWVGGTTLQTIEGVEYYPNMDDVAGGDINGDGDEEVLLIRKDAVHVPLVVRNPAGVALPRKVEIQAGGGWKRIDGGDFDGDGKDEIFILRETAYRIYTEPATTDAATTVSGSYLLQFAIGNLDGTGVPQAPILQVSANSVTFVYDSATLPPAQSVQVTNVGAGGSVAWTATVTQGQDWLSVTPTSGTTPGTLVLSVNPVGLGSGTYTGKVRVDAAGAANSPQIITVTLTVSVPILSVQPDALTFEVERGSPPINQVVAVLNIGTGGAQAITWQAEVIDGSPWLSISPAQGTTPSGFAVTVDPTGLAPGTYVGHIRVTADDPVVGNSPDTLTVTLVVKAPILKVTPTQLYLNISPGQTYSPLSVRIEQQGNPQGTAIQWVAGVIPSVKEVGRLNRKGWSLENVSRVSREGVTFGEGAEAIFVPGVDWVILTPWYGTTPSTMYVRIDDTKVGPGLHYATIIVDGGEGTMNRYQGIELTTMITTHRVYIPAVSK